MNNIQVSKVHEIELALFEAVFDQDRLLGKDYGFELAKKAARKTQSGALKDLYYGGFNQLILNLARLKNDFVSNEWGTKKTWKRKGFEIRDGESPAQIIYWLSGVFR